MTSKQRAYLKSLAMKMDAIIQYTLRSWNHLSWYIDHLYSDPADLKKEKYVVTPETTILPIIKLEINITKNVLFFTENDIEISRCL